MSTGAVPHIATYRDVTPMVDSTCTMITEALHRSSLWLRMVDGSLPFAGRAAYLEQHWEGLKVLSAALDTAAISQTVTGAAMQEMLVETRDSLGVALDRSHSTPRWQEHHVTMPSMLQYRRRIAELRELGATVELLAHAVVRLAAVRVCPMPGTVSSRPLPEVTAVFGDEAEELFAEELSAAMLMVLAHGSDVCRAYSDYRQAATCAVTAAAIRSSLR